MKMKNSKVVQFFFLKLFVPRSCYTKYIWNKKMIGKTNHQGARGVGELSLTHSCSC